MKPDTHHCKPSELIELQRILTQLNDAIAQVARSGNLEHYFACCYEEAVTQAIEALESLVMAYEASGEPLPEPSTICAVA